MTHYFLPLMLKGGDKQIVNLSSIGAHHIRPGFSAYQPGKLAILRFSEFINAEYGDQGVVSFAVHPGGVMTELAAAMPKETHSGEYAGHVIIGLHANEQQHLRIRLRLLAILLST